MKRSIKRWFGRNFNSTLVTGVVVTVAGAWATHWLGPTESTTIHRPPGHRAARGENGASRRGGGSQDPSVDQLLEGSRISFTDWQGLVKTNLAPGQRRQLVDRYRGARVVWSGVVDQVAMPDTATGQTPEATLVMYEDERTRTSRQLGRAPALCRFPVDAPRLAELRPGDRVVVRGTLAGPETLHGSSLGTQLYDCEILRR